MELSEYNSVDESETAQCDGFFLAHDITEEDFSEEAPEKWIKSDLSDLFCESYHDVFPHAIAQEVYNFVRMVAHPLRRCFDTPAKSPKNIEIESAIKNKGKPGHCTFDRDEGKFYVRPMVEWMFYGDNLRRKHFYTSDKRLALLYHDIDCHKEYQTQADAELARCFTEKVTFDFLGVSPHFLRSNRGENGYLKVDVSGVDPDKANQIFGEYESAMKLLFAKNELRADFEIKGTITWLDEEGKLHGGKYGKLPMCSSRWDYRWHCNFTKAKTVTIGQIESFVSVIKSQLSTKDIAGPEYAGKRDASEEKTLQVLDQEDIATNDLSGSIRSQKSTGGKAKVSRRIKKSFQDDLLAIGDETDSFVRQRKALLILARSLKRIPTIDEALQFIKDNSLYTGSWDNAARQKRVKGILRYIAKTFDTNKCNKSYQTVNLGKYDAWAKSKFPSGLTGGTRRFVTDELEVKELTFCGHIDWQFISVFVSICEYCLIVEANKDGSLPHERARELWKFLYSKSLINVAFCDRKFAAVRDALNKRGIIDIDRTKAPGKAWKWSVGQFFPLLGLWKKKKQRSVFDGVCWLDFVKELSITEKTQQGQHNSLLYMVTRKRDDFCRSAPARPPPTGNLC